MSSCHTVKSVHMAMLAICMLKEQLDLLHSARQVLLQNHCRLTHSRLYILLTESNSCLPELSWLHAALLLPARPLTGHSRLAALLGLLGVNYVKGCLLLTARQHERPDLQRKQHHHCG